MEQNKVTIEHVMEATIGILSQIQIRVDQMDNIGEPVKRAILNLDACLNAIRSHDNAQAEEAQEETEDERETDAE